MYVEGHKTILKDAIKFSNIHFTDDTIKEMKDGVIFPDLACASIIANPSTGLLTFKKKGYCSIFKLIKILHGKAFGFSTIYQFQRGILTTLHSMSQYLELPLYIVRKHILDMTLSLLVTIAYGDYGFEPRSSFWLGVIIHIISDSYPKAHTIRKGFHSVPIVQTEDLVVYGKTKKARRTLNKIIQTLSYRDELYSEEHLIAEIQKKINVELMTPEISYYLQNKSKSIHHTYLVYKFVHQLNKTALEYRKSLELPHSIGMYNGPAQKYDILSFQAYDYQSSIYHKREDLLSAVKNDPIYTSKLIPEISKLLQLYYDFYNNKMSADIFVKSAYEHISTTTFAVSKSTARNHTSFPMNALSNKFKITRIIKKHRHKQPRSTT